MSKEIVYRSTPKMFEDFIQSTIWQDMENELNAWIEDIRDSLESELEHEGMLRLQGNVEGIKKVLGLPKNVLDNIIEDINREKEEK